MLIITHNTLSTFSLFSFCLQNDGKVNKWWQSESKVKTVLCVRKHILLQCLYHAVLANHLPEKGGYTFLNKNNYINIIAEKVSKWRDIDFWQEWRSGNGLYALHQYNWCKVHCVYKGLTLIEKMQSNWQVQVFESLHLLYLLVREMEINVINKASQLISIYWLMRMENVVDFTLVSWYYYCIKFLYQTLRWLLVTKRGGL